ncbi:FAD-dependent oxidoreductase [Pseudoroseicyclus sp. CXY001]|uniref:FAD-dependent oxidoreductase n=1 Tax=Pseudoroseicyclus sp. CXY001 TaxID=3242492 RepID=UPI0035715601
MDVIIAGAGIGGLAAALAFARAGAGVTVLERHETFRDSGGGIQLTPNGARVLHALGLADKLDEIGTASQAVEAIDGIGGRRIFRMPIASDLPYRYILRWRLTEALAAAAEAAGARVELDCGVRAAHPEGEVELSSGDRRRADLVIGAEGINSGTRARLNGAARPFFTGNVAWRAVVEAEAPPWSRLWLLPGRHAVAYPVGPGLTNLVAVREQSSWVSEGWAQRDSPQAMQAAFGDACDDLRALLEKVEEVNLWGLFRHEVAPRWHEGRVAILGDAAHPTLPFLAQGANMAIEDAWALASEVTAGGAVEPALARYQARRRDRAAQVIAASSGNAKKFHLSGLPRFAGHAALRLGSAIAPRFMRGHYGWIYDHDETALVPGGDG